MSDSEYKTRLLQTADGFAAPVAVEPPSGPDVSYDDVNFEAASAEIGKLTSISGGIPDWRLIVENATGILAKKSKDVRLLVWGTIARLNVQGIEGFAEGLAITCRVIAAHWDTMSPTAKPPSARRARARANLFDWMNEQAMPIITALDATRSSGDAFRAAYDFFVDLDTLLAEKLGDAYSGTSGYQLKTLLNNKVRAIPEEVVEAPPPAVPEPAATPAAVAPTQTRSEAVSAAPSASIPAPAIPSVSGVDDAADALRSLGSGIIDVAKVLRHADATNPWPYRLHRSGIWLAIKSAPPAEGNVTRLPPPSAENRKKLESRLNAEQWTDLLNAAEEQSSLYKFWFDPHRLAALAMDRIGGNFGDARAALGREVVAFTQRFPGIAALSFNDRTPFADAATLMWLEQETSKYGGGGGGKVSGAATAEDEEVAKRFAEAKELVDGGKVAEGLFLANQLAARAADARLRFRGRLTVGELALQGGKPEVGRPILEQLVSEMETRGLDDWEPTLCASALSTLLAVYRALGLNLDGPEIKPFRDRLCRLDPAAGLKWSGS
ncbi:MAG TPA: type VI secretion system protein TssA [Polyangiaceae bacterium]|nr:type VI secretion system protein TssA [Polyangiaceae bacterium]